MTIRSLFASVLAVLSAGTVALVVTPSTSAATAADHGRRAQPPVVIGHRGASAHRPEHTLLSYEAAIAMGADYIEPDLVPTKDGVLVARHENEISQTTDVAERAEFAGRRATKTIDGRAVTGWFTEDFTLAELKTLRARERVPDLRPDNTAFDGTAQIPTFEEVVELALRHGVGVYPETKHPTYFDSIGLSLEEPLLETLERNRVRKAYIQSFETANLRELSGRTRLPLVQLIGATGAPYDWVAAGNGRTYDDMVTPEGLREVARYSRRDRRRHPARAARRRRRPDPGADRPGPRRPPRAAGRARVDRAQRELPAPRRPPAREPRQPRLPARHR
ncbi:glycerophosphodiester phosphodiesterase family protein [Nonomuraea ferruginea]